MKKTTSPLLKELKNTYALKEEDIKNIRNLVPFLEIETSLFVYLATTRKITFEDYQKFATQFQKSNPYLPLYDLSPRTFGQNWGEEKIRSLFPDFIKATKENLKAKDPSFSGEYNLWLDGIKVEVKACRANKPGAEALKERAYSLEEARKANFEYHFQQIKTSCADVFILIGVCRDQLLYWVLTSKEIQTVRKFSTQHRTETKGKEDIYEGQVFLTEKDLAPYQTEETKIEEQVRKKAAKEL